MLALHKTFLTFLEQLAQTVPNKTNTNTFNDESRQFNTPQEEYSRESTDGGLQTTRCASSKKKK